MEYEFKLKVRVSGNASEQEVLDFVGFNSGACGNISLTNPFFDEDGGAEIDSIEIEIL